MPSATLTSKGQLTIPVEVREALALKTGDKIDFFRNEDGTYTLQPKTGSIMDLQGILAKYGYARTQKAPTIEEMDEAILEGVAEDYRQSLEKGSNVREKAS